MVRKRIVSSFLWANSFHAACSVRSWLRSLELESFYAAFVEKDITDFFILPLLYPEILGTICGEKLTLWQNHKIMLAIEEMRSLSSEQFMHCWLTHCGVAQDLAAKLSVATTASDLCQVNLRKLGTLCPDGAVCFSGSSNHGCSDVEYVSDICRSLSLCVMREGKEMDKEKGVNEEDWQLISQHLTLRCPSRQGWQELLEDYTVEELAHIHLYYRPLGYCCVTEAAKLASAFPSVAATLLFLQQHGYAAFALAFSIHAIPYYALPSLGLLSLTVLPTHMHPQSPNAGGSRCRKTWTPPNSSRDMVTGHHTANFPAYPGIRSVEQLHVLLQQLSQDPLFPLRAVLSWLREWQLNHLLHRLVLWVPLNPSITSLHDWVLLCLTLLESEMTPTERGSSLRISVLADLSDDELQRLVTALREVDDAFYCQSVGLQRARDFLRLVGCDVSAQDRLMALGLTLDSLHLLNEDHLLYAGINSEQLKNAIFRTLDQLHSSAQCHLQSSLQAGGSSSTPGPLASKGNVTPSGSMLGPQNSLQSQERLYLDCLVRALAEMLGDEGSAGGRGLSHESLTASGGKNKKRRRKRTVPKNRRLSLSGCNSTSTDNASEVDSILLSSKVNVLSKKHDHEADDSASRIPDIVSSSQNSISEQLDIQEPECFDLLSPELDTELDEEIEAFRVRLESHWLEVDRYRSINP